MKKILSILALVTLILGGRVQAQEPAEGSTAVLVPVDTTRAIKIIDNYLGMLDFSKKRGDSIMYVVTKVVEYAHQDDTMYIYRWYQNPRKIRIEIWSGGQIVDGYLGDAVGTFRKFNTKYREWADVTSDSFFDVTMPFDIRGALYDWRSKGAEVSYAGEFNFQGHPVDRIFVASPRAFDRYYYFEKETGLLCFVTEEEHMFGDGEPVKNAQRVDWRAWNEFTPFRGFLMPTIESYQAEDMLVVMYHSYQYLAPNADVFSENYIKH